MDCTCDAEEGAAHGASCTKAILTKGEVVELIRNGSGSIIDDYLLLIEAGDTPEQAKEQAVDGALESVSCFLGLGSCGGGGCKH